MTDHYQSNTRTFETSKYSTGFGTRDPARLNERFTSEPRMEPSGHLDANYSSGGLGMNQRYTSASRIEATTLNESYQRGNKTIFDTKPGRASQGVSYADSPSYYDRPVSHEVVKKSAAPPVFTSVRNEVLDQLGDDRTKEKRLDERLDKQFGLESSNYYTPVNQHNPQPERRYTEESTGYEQTPSNKISSNQDLMNMILREDRMLRGHLPTEPDTAYPIPSESTGIQARITERETSPAKTKKQVDLANSPKRDTLMSSTDYHPYQTHATFAGSATHESYKKSVRAPIPEETSFDRSAHRSFTAGTPSSPLRATDFTGATRTETGRPIEEWNQRKMRELPRPGTTEEDDSDDEGVFCGICISTKGSQAKKAAQY